ncbi:PAS and ANTAR domain-containing protein [Nocardia nova]|uniref:PAS and ANTAR domain-containing protein n=1 Tax=Nocardia nova TaxID=37330 RepID=UPI001C455CDE|nr:PAS and ANTAR domain-containing protein [Nocardia nova]MBV7706810.1 PAS and ANTAR domain-containing protein [Nocardia nova]
MSDTGAIGDDGARAGAGPEAGSFRFWFATRRWEWSPELYRMLGYTPGAVEPTTELLLAHHHRDDHDAVVAKLTRALDDGTPFSSRHRLRDTGGAVHEVMVVADRITDDSGAPVGTSGFYLDLTATLAANARDALAGTMPGVMASRAVIEQAKGVLMRMYRINAEQAFKVLSWRSQETNTKIRDLAAQLVADLDELPRPAASVVTEFDHLLLTAHTRIRPPADD